MAGEEVGAIFEAQALFARDPGIVDPALAAVDAGRVGRRRHPRDDRRAGRATLARRRRRVLPRARRRRPRRRAAGRGASSGRAPADLWHADGHPAILVGDDLDPSAVAGLRPELVAGIALAGGAPTGHAAIVARALGIPLVLGLGAAGRRLRDGAELAVDGTAGRLLIDPDAADLAALDAGSGARRPTRRAAPAPSTATLAGIAIVANVASAGEAEAAAAAGAAGIGLVRTELLFLGRSRAATVAEQRATYARIRAALPAIGRSSSGRSTSVATSRRPGRPERPEANPALGVRGIRLGRARRVCSTTSSGPCSRPRPGGELRIMLPMVATRDEVDAARARLDAIVADVAAGGGPSPGVRLGVMIEVPAAAIMADALAEVGRLLLDRDERPRPVHARRGPDQPELADLAAPQPAVLRLIDGVVRAAAARGRHVAVCGEAAADPSVIPLLVGLGVDELSVAPASIQAVRGRAGALDEWSGAARSRHGRLAQRQPARCVPLRPKGRWWPIDPRSSRPRASRSGSRRRSHRRRRRLLSRASRPGDGGRPAR